MRSPSPLRIKYWGTIGSFPRTINSSELVPRIARSIDHLSRSGNLAKAIEHSMSLPDLENLIRRHVPSSIVDTYGVHTTCIELTAPDLCFLIDAGSGLEARNRASLEAPTSADSPAVPQGNIFLTHAHLDHLCGIPFAEPLFDPQNEFTIWGTRDVLDQIQGLFGAGAGPNCELFPVSLSELRGIKSFRQVKPGIEFELLGTRINTHLLNHPGGCVAYRFDRAGRRIVIATDHEHAAGADRALAQFAAGADLLYLDAQYTELEYSGQVAVAGASLQPRRGWGHSTIEACLETGLTARVRNLHLGHHEPRRSDQELAELEERAQLTLADLALQFGAAPPTLQFARESVTWEF